VYHKILVTLDATKTDRAILEHIRTLAKLCKASVVLLHVADGWAARTYGAHAVSKEVEEDKAYLAKVKAELDAEDIPTETELAYGDPATEIIRWVRREHCDLIAMSTHGHRLLADMVLGTTVTKVRHTVNVPVLLVKAKR
jgi:nucleotide-binding universal stress UspA family protein